MTRTTWILLSLAILCGIGRDSRAQTEMTAPSAGMPSNFPTQATPFAGETGHSLRFLNSRPATLNEPLDPLTGLPLRLTSLATHPQGRSSSAAVSQNGRASQSGSASGSTGTVDPGGLYGPGPQYSPGMFPIPAGPSSAATPLNQTPGPVFFAGQLESMEGEPLGTIPGYSSGAPAPNQRIELPIPKLDPPLHEAGNGDGQLDWIDLIDEYAGRATRSDMPWEPAEAAHEDRSWLRIDHWNAEANWLAGRGDYFGLGTGSGSMTIGLPKIQGVTVRPSGAFHSVFGPDRTDLPSQLYDGSVEVAWMHRFDDRMRMRLAGGAGVFSDFETSNDLEEAVRFSGSGIGTFEVHPDLQLVLGAAWINLENRRVLPVAGVVWSPSDDLRLDLVCPEGRVSIKLKEMTEKTRWFYLSGAFYGRTWQIERANGTLDLVTYSDLRFGCGIETRHISGISSFLEFGVSLNRELEYESGAGDYSPRSVSFLRAGLHF